MNHFKGVCNERIDSSVHELTSFVKTFVHESCENMERKAIEAARGHVVTVCEPFATKESSLLHEVTCRKDNFESRVKTMIADSCDIASCHLAIEAGAKRDEEKFGTIDREFERRVYSLRVCGRYPPCIPYVGQTGCFFFLAEILGR